MKTLAISILWLTTLWASAAPPPVNQATRWQAAKIDPRRSIELAKLLDRWRRTQAPYQKVERMHENGVPAVVAFCLFYREADNDMRKSPAQGDPLTRYSVNEPKGRIPGKRPPFLWTDAAYDAYYVVDKLHNTTWSNLPSVLDKLTSFNGYGYDKYHPEVPTPYLWGGTSLQRPGKYVADGKFDRDAMDKQLGVAALLLFFHQKGERLPF